MLHNHRAHILVHLKRLGVDGERRRVDIGVCGRESRRHDGVRRGAAGEERRDHVAFSAHLAEGAEDLAHAVAGFEDEVPIACPGAGALGESLAQMYERTFGGIQLRHGCCLSLEEAGTAAHGRGSARFSRTRCPSPRDNSVRTS